MKPDHEYSFSVQAARIDVARICHENPEAKALLVTETGPNVIGARVYTLVRDCVWTSTCPGPEKQHFPGEPGQVWIMFEGDQISKVVDRRTVTVQTY